MTGFLMKLIIFPLVLFIADKIIPGIDYSSGYQPIIVGVVLAIVAHVAELLILKEGTLWVSTIADFVLAGVVVYYGTLWLPGTRITLAGALITAVVLTGIELYEHVYLTRSGRTRKA